MASNKEPTFKPTPPALRLMIRTLDSRDGALNPITASLRFLMSIDPSNRYHGRPSRSNTFWIRSRKEVNWENTTARKHGSWSFSRPTASSGGQSEQAFKRKLTKMLHKSFKFGRRPEVVPTEGNGACWRLLLRVASPFVAALS